MPPLERDSAYLWDMRQAAREVLEITAGMTLSEFLENRVILRATERTLEIIGEAARRVSEEFKAAHPELPWRNIIGMRNVLAHEYGRIDHQALFRTVREDIPQVIDALGSLIDEAG